MAVVGSEKNQCWEASYVVSSCSLHLEHFILSFVLFSDHRDEFMLVHRIQTSEAVLMSSVDS